MTRNGNKKGASSPWAPRPLLSLPDARRSSVASGRPGSYHDPLPLLPLYLLCDGRTLDGVASHAHHPEACIRPVRLGLANLSDKLVMCPAADSFVYYCFQLRFMVRDLSSCRMKSTADES